MALAGSVPAPTLSRALLRRHAIHPQYVISAGHCFEKYSNASRWSVRVGKHDKYNSHPYEQTRGVEQVIMHSKYNQYNLNNDIALIKLDKEVDVTKMVKPACLPKLFEPLPAGTMCYTTGWGNVQGTCCDQKLKQTMVPVIGNSDCDGYYPGQITDNMICAGYVEGGQDACQGDSGGPFVCQDGDHWNLQGITSWGRGCAQPKQPGVYARVANYIDWIDQQMKNSMIKP